MKTRYILLIVTVIIILVIGFYSVNLYKNSIEKQPGHDILEEEEQAVLHTPDRELKGVELSFFNQDKTVVWKLSSEHISDYTEDALLKLDSLFIQAVNHEDSLFNSSEKELYSITGVEADYYQAQGRIEISGPVKIKNTGLEITAGRLSWTERDNILEGEDGITFETPFSLVSGKSFSADMLMDRIIVYGDENNQAHIKYKE